MTEQKEKSDKKSALVDNNFLVSTAVACEFFRNFA